MYTFTLTFLFISISISLSAQVITVKDFLTDNPLPGTTITNVQPGIILVTDISGKADISNLSGSDSLIFSSSGYQTTTITIDQLTSSKNIIFLKEDVFHAEEVVISASKFEESARDVPRQIQVFNEKNIRFANQQTTADLLQNTGNVFVQKSQMGGGSPILRGFEANKLLLVVDGIRMNNAIYRGGHLQNVITIDNNMLERTEVIFGAGSVIYGSDALGGVIHFYTKKPDLSNSIKPYIKGNGNARFSSANLEKTIHADMNFGFKKIAFLSSITFSDFDNLKQGNNRSKQFPDFGKNNFYVERIANRDSVLINENPNIQRNSGYRQLDIMQKILLVKNEKVSHLLNFQYSTTNNIPRFDRLAQFNKTPAFSSWYYGPQKRLLVSYHLDYKVNKILYDQFKLILSFQNIDESRHDRRFNNVNLNHRIENVKAINLNSDFSKQIKNNEIRYGLEGTINYVNSSAYKENIVTNSKSSLDTRYPNGGSNVMNLSAYFTHSIELNKRFIFNEGIRFSYSNLQSKFSDSEFYPFPFQQVTQINKAFNGSLGIVYLPGASYKFSLLGSTGYRVPNIDDLSKVFESVPGKVIVPNINLKPEYTYNAEFGMYKQFSSIAALEGNVYYTLYTNAITVGKGNFNGSDSILYDGSWSEVQQNLNAGKGYIYGYNASLKLFPTKNVEINNSINYTFGRIKTDTVDYPLDHIPPVYGRSSVCFKAKKIKGEFYVLYNGWKRLKDYNLVGEDNISQATTAGMPSWYTLNIKGEYYFAQYLSLQLGIENLLDRNYRVFASGISAPGRNFIISIRGNIGGR